ncbi:hypothetical protein ACFE04_020578 [Oxalis oulophora]
MESKIHNERKPSTLPLKIIHNLQNTPLETCDNIILPIESKQSQEGYFFEWSSIDCHSTGTGDDDSKKISWSKKLKRIKKFFSNQKLKASCDYFLLLFNKASCASDACTIKENNIRNKEIQRKYSKTTSSSSITSSWSSSFSFSSSSSGFNDLQSLKTRIGLNSENDNSIEGAVAHCNESQLRNNNRKVGDYQRARSSSFSG